MKPQLLTMDRFRDVMATAGSNMDHVWFEIGVHQVKRHLRNIGITALTRASIDSLPQADPGQVIASLEDTTLVRARPEVTVDLPIK